MEFHEINTAINQRRALTGDLFSQKLSLMDIDLIAQGRHGPITHVASYGLLCNFYATDGIKGVLHPWNLFLKNLCIF